MQNIILDDGCKEFSINNDPNRVIRFNPADIAILERVQTASKAFEDFRQLEIEINPDGTPVFEAMAEKVAEMDQKVREQIDYVFNYPVADIAFGGQSPLSTVKGVPLYERFLMAVMPIIKESVVAESKESRKRIDKYVSAAKKV